jgi:hypothetical protein
MTHALTAFRTTRVWLLVGLDSAVLVLAIAAGLRSLAVAWVLAHLLFAWWCSGARNGRRLREAILGAVTIAVLANFLSSWFGLVAGLPIGAAVRDVAFVLLVAAAVHERRRLPISVARALAYGALVIATIASFHGAPSLSEIVGARTYLLYPLLLLPVASELNTEWREATGRLVIWILLALALVGLGEVATSGRLLAELGYRPDYAETSTLAASPYFHGLRRATGGLGNFLEFGLVMILGLILARAFLRGPARVLASAGFLAAAFFSWSRLAWALAVLVMVAPIETFKDGHPRVRFTRLVSGGLLVLAVVGLLMAFGPKETATNRLFARDNLSQQSDLTRSHQLQLALRIGGRSLIGAGAGTQGAAADRTGAPAHRIVTDNSYLIWLLELGWLGVVAILLLSILVVGALWTTGEWWGIAVVGALALANGLFAASDSRVVLVVAFIALRLLWLPAPAAPPRVAQPATAIGLTWKVGAG